jgi:hypothetical protein
MDNLHNRAWKKKRKREPTPEDAVPDILTLHATQHAQSASNERMNE